MPICSDPFHLNIKKKTHKCDVRGPTANYLARCREFLPNTQWTDDIKLCLRCRCEVSSRIKTVIERQEAGRFMVAAIADLIPDAPVNQPEVRESSGSSESQDSGAEQNVNDGNDDDQVQSEAGTENSLKSGQREGSGESSEGNDISNTGDVLSPSTSLVQQINNPLPSTSASVCHEGSIASSGVVYTDKAVAVDTFNKSTKILGESPLAAGTGRKPAALRDKFKKTTDRLKSVLEEATGTSITETEALCNCSYCTKMIASIKAKYPELETKKEKYSMLTCLPKSVKIPDMQTQLHLSKYMARKVSKYRNLKGPFSVPEFKSSAHRVTDDVLQKVRAYYLNDDNSRPSPSERETLKVLDPDGVKRVHAKRFMLVNSKDAYQEFRNENKKAKIGATKFIQLKPKQCKWPGNKGFPITCACIIHENFHLMVGGLKNACIDNIASADDNEDNDDGNEEEQDDLGDESEEVEQRNNDAAVVYAVLDNTSELVNFVVCGDPTELCYVGVCLKCPNQESFDLLFKFVTDDEIEFDLWETKPTTTLNQLRMPSDDFKDKFYSVLQTFLVHEYIYKQQKQFITELKAALPANPQHALINVDFGENYSFVVQTAVQGFHWSNNQATIHPIVVYFSNQGENDIKYKTYFIISDEMAHDATTFHVFRTKAIEIMKKDLPLITHVDYFSDGAGSQYKNFKNIANLVYHKQDYGLTANWHFTATSHGKSMCDAMSAVVKRTCRLKSIKDGVRILTPLEMFNVVQGCLTTETMQILFASKAEVEIARTTLLHRYESARKIPGIRKLHCFKVREDGKIIGQIYSNSDHHELFTIVSEEDEPRDEQPEDEMQINIGDFYTIFVCKTYQVGKVVVVNHDAEECTMTMMKKAGKAGVSLSWPPVERERIVSFNDLLGRVEAPEISGAGRTYRLTAQDLAMAKQGTDARVKMFVKNQTPSALGT